MTAPPTKERQYTVTKEQAERLQQLRDAFAKRLAVFGSRGRHCRFDGERESEEGYERVRHSEHSVEGGQEMRDPDRGRDWQRIGAAWKNFEREYGKLRRSVSETGFPQAPAQPVQDPEAPVCRRCKRELAPLEVNGARLCANCETALFGDV